MTDSLLPNILQFLGSVDPFDKIPKVALREIAAHVQISYLGKGQNIDLCNPSKEKSLYVIRTGSIEQRKSDGVLRAKLGPEDLFGFTMLGATVDSNQGYHAIAIENSLLYVIPQRVLTSLFTTYPECAEHFASQAQLRLKSGLDLSLIHI